jgi:uncharacterized protein (DUF362 family)
MKSLGISFTPFLLFAESIQNMKKSQTKEIFPPRSSNLQTDLTQSHSKVVLVEGTDINMMMKKGLEALNLPPLFFENKPVLIKPNTHWSQDYPSTTDPASIIPVIDFFRYKKSGKITISDGSGIDLPDYRVAFKHIGFEKILGVKGVDIEPIDIRRSKDFVAVKNPGWTVFDTLFIHHMIYRAPVVVSMTCLKRHGTPHLTAALKNNVGAISARSRNRLHYHVRGKMKEAIAEISDAVRPDVSIIDARKILIRSGPMLKTDHSNLKKGVNKLLLSLDMVALDSVAAQLMAEHDQTFRFERFRPTLIHAQKLELGHTEKDQIDIIELKA